MIGGDCGWGLLDQFPPFRYFPEFFHHWQNVGYLFNITFISDRCPHSSAAMTPVKYESDSKNPTGIKNFLNGKLNEWSFSNQTGSIPKGLLNTCINKLSYQHHETLMMRWSHDCLIFIMGIPKPVKTVFVLKQGPVSMPSAEMINYVTLPWQPLSLFWWDYHLHWVLCLQNVKDHLDNNLQGSLLQTWINFNPSMDY